MGQSQDAVRVALRLPALCGAPSRQEAQQVLGLRVARQREVTSQMISLIKQRREVLGQGTAIESLGQNREAGELELMASPKNQSNYGEMVPLAINNANRDETHFSLQETPWMTENVNPTDMRKTAVP